MKFPSIADVAKQLRLLNANVECECEVRLQVYPDGRWVVRWGDSGYDQDHRGYWGSGFIPGVVRGVVKRFNSRDLARYLIEECREAHAQDVEP